jgi:hypothetical protein
MPGLSWFFKVPEGAASPLWCEARTPFALCNSAASSTDPPNGSLTPVAHHKVHPRHRLLTPHVSPLALTPVHRMHHHGPVLTRQTRAAVEPRHVVGQPRTNNRRSW